MIDRITDPTPFARALRLRVGATGSRIALRTKHRGRWYARSWNEIAALLDDATADALAVPLRAEWTIDQDRLAAAEARTAAHALGPDDVGLLLAPRAWQTHGADLVAEWIVAGFTLVLPEHPDSVGVDIRESRPTYVFAPSRTFDAIHGAAEARLAAPGTRKRALLVRALRRPGSLAHTVASTLVRRAIGWERVRLAVALEGVVDPAAAQFFAALGARVVESPAPQSPSRVRAA